MLFLYAEENIKKIISYTIKQHLELGLETFWHSVELLQNSFNMFPQMYHLKDGQSFKL